MSKVALLGHSLYNGSPILSPPEESALNKYLLRGLLLLFTTAGALGKELPPKPGDSPLLNTPFETPDFLPVEDAYQLNPRIENGALYLDWIIAPGYYLYQHRFRIQAFGPGGERVKATPTFADGTHKYDDYYQKELVVYYQATSIPLQIDKIRGPLSLRVESQGCAEAGLCYPPRTQTVAADFSQSIATVLEALPPNQPTAGNGAPSAATPALLITLCFALLGGIILNLMPCVFPVLSIKVMSFASAHLGPHGRHVHGFAYTGGIVCTFISIALLLMALRAAGKAIGWGFQLQSPLFVSLLIYLFFLMGLSFMGIGFTLGGRLMNLGQNSTQGHSLRASFMTGVLATVVASPCTAPFMGTALGFALTQPTHTAILVFLFLGLGMALPFLLLAWWPGLVKRLPKPGPWMENFRQFLAFPLFLSAVWLLWVLGRQAGADAVALVVTGLVLLAFALWLQHRFRAPWRLALTLLAVIGAGALLFAHDKKGNESSATLWQPFTQQRLAALRAEGRPVFINLTADWCLTCLANEKIALRSDAFKTALQQHGIVYLKGDWTRYNPEITQLLNAHGRSGVPLYLLYPAGPGEAKILPQLLTASLIQEAFAANNR